VESFGIVTGPTTRISKWSGPMKWKQCRPLWWATKKIFQIRSPKTVILSVSKFNYTGKKKSRRPCVRFPKKAFYYEKLLKLLANFRPRLSDTCCL